MKWMGMALLVMFGSACSTLSVNKAEVGKVKSAAVIGFGADLSALKPAANNSQRGGIMGTINAVNQFRKMGDGRFEEERRAQADGSFDLVVERFSKDMGWKVLGTETSSNATYASEYQNRTASKWLASSTEALGSRLYVKGIMWDGDAKRMSAAERDHLMEALGVDAIAITTITFQVGRVTGFGKVTRHPQAILELLVYDRGNPDPIWHDRYAAGVATEGGFTETMGFADTGDATPILLDAVKLGLDELMVRYKQAEDGS